MIYEYTEYNINIYIYIMYNHDIIYIYHLFSGNIYIYRNMIYDGYLHDI